MMQNRKWLEGDKKSPAGIRQRRGNWERNLPGGATATDTPRVAMSSGGVRSGTAANGGVEPRAFSGSATALHHLELGSAASSPSIAPRLGRSRVSIGEASIATQAIILHSLGFAVQLQSQIRTSALKRADDLLTG